ncbi:MAG: Smr/MutS family protein [Nannocystaceae bacterium]
MEGAGLSDEVRERLLHELRGLGQVAAQAGDVKQGPTGESLSWRYLPSASDGLPIELVARGDLVTIKLGPWVRRDPQPDPEPGAVDEWIALTLDLVGAALFGCMQVHVSRLRASRALVGVEVELQQAGRWTKLAYQTGNWRARLRAMLGVERQTLANELVAPAKYRPTEVAQQGLAWARWAGAAGFWCADGPAWDRSSTKPVRVAIDGTLDLHLYKPKQVKKVVRSYLDACHAEGVVELRIIHGKGIGNLRRTVHALLERDSRVAGFRLGGAGEGGWGATVVVLERADAG